MSTSASQAIGSSSLALTLLIRVLQELVTMTARLDEELEEVLVG